MPNNENGHRHHTPDTESFLATFEQMMEVYAEDPLRFFATINRILFILNETEHYAELCDCIRQDINVLLHSVHELGYQWMDMHVETS